MSMPFWSRPRRTGLVMAVLGVLGATVGGVVARRMAERSAESALPPAVTGAEAALPVEQQAA